MRWVDLGSWRGLACAGLLAVFAVFSPAPVAAQERPIHRTGGPLVIELFTSQSCDNCSRANRMLGEFARERDVIALTFSVDYWDYLGWRDTFAQADFSRRQRAYRSSIGLRGLLTPEIVVNGVRHTRARRAEEVERAVGEFANAPLRPGPSITITRRNGGASLAIGSGAALSEPADIWVIPFDPGPVWQTIGGGANRGRRMPHYNLVLDIRRAGAWSGAPVSFDRISCARDCAVIVQGRNGGPILAAARTPPRR